MHKTLVKDSLSEIYGDLSVIPEENIDPKENSGNNDLLSKKTTKKVKRVTAREDKLELKAMNDEGKTRYLMSNNTAENHEPYPAHSLKRKNRKFVQNSSNPNLYFADNSAQKPKKKYREMSPKSRAERDANRLKLLDAIKF